MEFVYQPELVEYMNKTGKRDIIVELVSIDHSDIEMTDLHVFLANEKQIALFRDEKKYRCVKTSEGNVWLPKYKFETDEKIVFELKSFWIFKTLKYSGIRI